MSLLYCCFQTVSRTFVLCVYARVREVAHEADLPAVWPLSDADDGDDG